MKSGFAKLAIETKPVQLGLSCQPLKSLIGSVIASTPQLGS